jgi:hypothetical protein
MASICAGDHDFLRPDIGLDLRAGLNPHVLLRLDTALDGAENAHTCSSFQSTFEGIG